MNKRAMVPPLRSGNSPVDHSSLGLAVLYDLAELASGSRGSKSAAEGIMNLFSTRLSTTRGIVGYLAPRRRQVPVLSTLGMQAGDIAIFRESGLEAKGSVFVFPGKRGADKSPAVAGRDGIDFFGALVPGKIEGSPFIAVDSLFGDGVDPAEDMKLLSAAAAVLRPVFKKRKKKKKEIERRKTLGRILHKHIKAWIAPMDPSRNMLRSDLYERVMSEVEKILLAEALAKTDHVQTEAARFLGINRNTLSRKVKKYGLGGE